MKGLFSSLIVFPALTFCGVGVGDGVAYLDKPRPVPKPIPVKPVCDQDFDLDRRYFDGYPGVFNLYAPVDFIKLCKPKERARLKRLGFGTFLIHEKPYTNGARPVNGTYTYKRPILVRHVVRVLRTEGFHVAGYVHPRFVMYRYVWDPAVQKRVWVPQASATDVLVLIEKMMDEHGWDSVFLDGTEVGPTVWETWDWMRRVRHIIGEKGAGDSGILIVHNSVRANLGRVSFVEPWLHLADYAPCGEGGGSGNPPPPQSLDDPAWRYVISVAPYGVIGMYKPTRPCRWHCANPNFDPGWLRRLPGNRCVPWGGYGGVLDTYEKHFWPAYKKERARWRSRIEK